MKFATVQNPIGCLQSLDAEIVFTQTASGQYLSFYWQAAQQHNLKNEQVVGCLLDGNFSPVATNNYLKQISRILELGIPERCSYLFRYGDKYFNFDLVISPILQPDGTAKTVLVMGRQINQLSIESQEVGLLSSPNQYQKQLSQVARNIRRTLDLETIWRQTVEGLGQALNVEQCIICSYKPDSRKMLVEAAYYPAKFNPEIVRSLDLDEDQILTEALATLEPIMVDRLKTDLFQPKAVLVVATSYQDQPNGLICLQRSVSKNYWTTAEVELVRELGDQVGTAIAHAILYKDLEQAREQAEEASRMKSAFLANTSHELRTPLNGIIGFLKLILEGMADDPEEQRDFIQEAYRSGLHLLNIINDILDIAKIEAGKMELALGQVKLAELFSDVEDFTRTQVQQKNLNFTWEMPATHDGLIVYGNYQRLLQVMLNLVGNSIKFTHEGGITISAEVIKKKITFEGQELPGMVKISVADTGIGVSLEKQDKLFQSFNQVDTSHTRQYGGTGLGLTISQRLVEMMGGVVNFYSMGEGLGATVMFTVPLYQEPVMLTKY